ncbi:acid protease [Gymnopus androsaceus JB14]|uniref:Acid protease n=1 Tax=Gymnopus androsaceus JB14 TaxID=1447944 RepID=A0A6A4HN84_9AGAR|nr:acid protease [Gymnopus androsaceus JB14]
MDAAEFLSFLSLLAFLSPVTAISFPVTGTRRKLIESKLLKRDQLGNFGNGSLSLYNDEDVVYTCNITLGGNPFVVELDTGRRSADLWVAGDVSGTKNLSIPMQLAYGKGLVAGYINSATLGFDGFTVPDQVYLNVVTSQGESTSVGIIGLGPNAESSVRRLLNEGATGDPPLDRIFGQNRTTPNFISFLLSRDPIESPSPLAEQWPAQFTIGEVIPGLEGYQKLDKSSLLLIDQYGNQHWETLLDSNGIIGPDGKRISTSTSIANPCKWNQGSTALLFLILPKDIVDEIYGRVPGAEFIESGSSLAHDLQGFSNFWRVPCAYELNVSFVFGGVEYPISPLDLTVDIQEYDQDRKEICIAFFQQTAANIVDNPSFGALDAVLGMAFLRNVYILINFGDFVDGSSSSVAKPYIQLLSLSDKASIHRDFVMARLGGVDTTGSQSPLLPSVSSTSASTSTSTTNSDPTSSQKRHSKEKTKIRYLSTRLYVTAP